MEHVSRVLSLRFLFSCRITPHATTGLSPAELMMSRRMISTFALLLPDVKLKVQQKQLKQKENHDTKKSLRSFAPGDVFIRNYSFSPKWIPAVIECSSGPVSYKVVIGTGKILKRHVDQVRATLRETVPSEPDKDGVLQSENRLLSENCLSSRLDTTPQL